MLRLTVEQDSAEIEYRGATARAGIAIDQVLLDTLAVDPDGYGLALGQALFSAELGAVWQAARLAAGDQLPVRLHVHAWPDLIWERLYAPAGDAWRAVAADSATPFARVVGSQSLQPLAARVWPGRVLSAVASPSSHPDYGFPALSAELGALSMPHWTIERLEIATRSSLREALTHRPDIVHLVAHGLMSLDTGYLILASADGRLDPVSSDDLAVIITETASPGLVVLLACDSARSSVTHQAISARLVRAGIDAVIGMNDGISLEAARQFSRVLYERLADGDPLDAAVNAGRAGLRAGYDWSIPVLSLRMDEQPAWIRPNPAPGQVFISATTGGVVSIGGHVIAGDATIINRRD